MQRDRLIKLCLFLLIGVGLFLVSKGEVFALSCSSQGKDCGPSWPFCWDKNCDACPAGCAYPTCDGGVVCYPSECSDCGLYPFCWDKYCKSSCEYGCSKDTCLGKECNDKPEPKPKACINKETKCKNNVYSLCVGNQWKKQYDCYLGCDANGKTCNFDPYCEDSDCRCKVSGDPNYDKPGYLTVKCWTDANKKVVMKGYPTCIFATICVIGVCRPVTSTCGGTLTEERCNELYPGKRYVSHIDNCGGLDCGPSCTGGGNGDCIPQYPNKPVLTSPINEEVIVGTSVTLSWQESGYGVGCPQSNSQSLYLEVGNSLPSVEVASLGSGVNSYGVSGLETGTLYYWRLMANNGDRGMSSDVFSFSLNGLIEGYFFDSGGMSVCPADLSDPVYDLRKIGGGKMDITGTRDYLDVTSVADGSYSQAVTIPGSYVLGNFRLGSGFVSSPDLVCDGSSVDFVLGGAGIAVRSFGFLRDYNGWWQAVGGDVYGGGGIGSVIPASCVGACEAYLIKADINGESGLVKYLSGGVDLGDNENASVGPDGWVVNSGYTGQNTSYAYYTSKMALIEKTSWVGSGKPVFNPEVGSDYEIYVYTGTAVIDFDVAADEKMIFMVGGDVDVSSNVDVAEGGHLAVIASGRITFANDVSQVEGWWVGDSLSIESTGDEGTEVVFRGEGSFIGWNGVSLNRDRGESNATEPAEEFVFRPDLMINAPIALKFSRYVWQEKAP